MSPHHALVGRATRFKNALTFDGGIGQSEPVLNPTTPGAPAHQMETGGKLINYGQLGNWTYTTGDATAAYRGSFASSSWPWKMFNPLLSNAVRSVAYNKSEKAAVIYDYATSNTPRSFELNFQSSNAPVITGNTIKISNGGVDACLDMYGTPGSFTATTGFPIAPEQGYSPEPDQWRIVYTPSSPTTTLATVGVIREDCRQATTTVTFNDTQASVFIGSSTPMLFDKRLIKTQQ